MSENEVVYVTKTELAKHLGVSGQVVQNWISRKLISCKTDPETNHVLVELINERPTRRYTVNAIYNLRSDEPVRQKKTNND
jgi:hypothetical protein